MLIDATHAEETRVAVISGNRLEEYDHETAVRRQLKSNIYLVKVTRVEPSLQAAFVDFGGNRHGFLPFPEIHSDYYRIPIADREALLAEERALAAAQAAREDEEDAAELAASGESLDDIDLESEGEEGSSEEATPETYVSKHTGSIAAEIEQDTIVDSGEEEDDAEDGAAEAGEEESQSAEEPSETAEGQPAPAEREKATDVDIVGGDAVEAPVYRSSIKRRYKIQEVIKRNQIMLIQISKEERGNKGAAVTSYISLPGRYCVLMPNSPRGGGVSRKVMNVKDRQRLKKILQELNVPDGMSVILRTAGVSRGMAEIKRDLDYLLRLWDQIRELTLKSTAPALIYEEGNLIKRSIRDLYKRDIDEVWVAGEEGYKSARDFMTTLMPSHADRVRQYTEENIPLFFRYQVESQIDAIHSPTVHLKSGGYIVINPTEAMVSIDVNSGRATKGRHIEETALKTNIEAAEEIARQLRLRDQGGLIVIDFIDMEDNRNNRIVEKRLRDAMQHDRARIQLGRISTFGLLELSRQRLHPSLVETNFETCKHCNGSGLVRTVETTGVIVLRAIEEEGLRGRASEIKVNVPAEIALYIFNNKREMLSGIEKRYGIKVFIHADDDLVKPNYSIDVLKASGVQNDQRPKRLAPVQGVDISDLPEIEEEAGEGGPNIVEAAEGGGGGDRDHGRHRRDRGGNRDRGAHRHARHGGGGSAPAPENNAGGENVESEGDRNNRRRGRRGGRGRGRGRGDRPDRGDGGGGRHGGGRHHHDRNAQQGGAPAAASSATQEHTQAHQHTQRQAPSHEHVSSPAPANEGEGGDKRKGWWKRLTE